MKKINITLGYLKRDQNMIFDEKLGQRTAEPDKNVSIQKFFSIHPHLSMILEELHIWLFPHVAGLSATELQNKGMAVLVPGLAVTACPAPFPACNGGLGAASATAAIMVTTAVRPHVADIVEHEVGREEDAALAQSLWLNGGRDAGEEAGLPAARWKFSQGRWAASPLFGALQQPVPPAAIGMKCDKGGWWFSWGA